MTSAAKIVCVTLFAVLPLYGANLQMLKSADARKLAVAAMPSKDVKSSDVTIELDRAQNQCAIYHAYRLSRSEPESQSFTIGWWSVDLRTAEVWDELNAKRVTNQRIEAIQRRTRRRFGVTADEIAASIANPCYARYAK